MVIAVLRRRNVNAITLYRLCHWFYRHRIPILPRLLYYATFVLFNSVVPGSCTIGAGSLFAYGGIGVVLHAKCVIGKGVMIGQNVTIGGSFGEGPPNIGDNVWISPGARIIGSIRVGKNVIIGANAVVIRDVPDNCIVAGVPARVLRQIPAGSLDAIHGLLDRSCEEPGSPRA
jgi:serine O-acetyltransferase